MRIGFEIPLAPHPNSPFRSPRFWRGEGGAGRLGGVPGFGMGPFGSEPALSYERDDEGRLIAIRCGERVYLEQRDGVRVLGDGLARVREKAAGTALLRHVETAESSWTETYVWDAGGRLARVDGVEIERDERGRITACLGPGGQWRYGYGGDGLVEIAAPSGRRRLSLGPDGRPGRWWAGNRSRDVRYDDAGCRVDVPAPPAGWERDPLGRLWTLRGDDGRVLATYLWDGFACLGRIDGPPGAPLGALFSLDPSQTPVRIIEPGRVVRVPRDAFGEGLLAHPGVPGLHGGAVHAGFVFYRSRALDPSLGAFAAPDPWHGGESDPRRTTGYRGPLPVEMAAGPYAVCRHDPVGRTDPTGEMSSTSSGRLLSLLSLTWASQHNLAGLFMVDLLNLLLALFSFDGDQLGQWTSKSAVSSTWHGGWGFRFDPVGIKKVLEPFMGRDRVWTYHHLVWAAQRQFDELAMARVFVPETAFRPSLYGTLLRFLPIYGPDRKNPPGPFVLRGASNSTRTTSQAQLFDRAPGWTRAGGVAEPVIPGAPLPHFPAGGFHFAPRDDVPCTQERTYQEGTLTELEPVGIVATGKVEDRKVLALPRTGLGLAAGNLLLLTDATLAELVEVRAVTEVGGESRVRLQTDPTLVATTGLRARGLGTPVATESLNRTGDRLDARAPASTNRYTAGQLLRLSQGGTMAGVALIDRLEAAVQVDVALTAPGGRPPHRLSLAQPAGTAQSVTKSGPSQLSFPAPQTPPVEGEAIVVEGGGATQALLVTGAPAERERTIDRPLDAAIVDPITWRQLRAITPLGTWDGQTGVGSTGLVYVPERSGEAPATGNLLVKDADNRNRLARQARVLDRDELILKSPPAGPDGAYAIETIPIQAPDVSGGSLRTVTALVLDGPVAPALTAQPRPALQLNRLNGGTIAAATTGTVSASVIGNVSVAGTSVTIDLATGGATFPAGGTAGLSGTLAPTPGQLVVLQGGAGTAPEPVLVKEVWLTVTLRAALPLSGSNLEVVRLEPGGPAYQAALVPGPAGSSRVVLQPVAFRLDGSRVPLRTATGAVETVAAQMPRFREGDLVEALWGPAGSVDRDRFRVKQVDGTTLHLEGPSGAGLPAAPVDLAVARLVPADPGTGGSRVALSGTITPTSGPTQIRARVWGPNALNPDDPIAITDGTRSFPAVVSSVDRLEIVFYNVPASYGGASGVTIVVPGLVASSMAQPNPVYVADYAIEGNDLLLPGNPLPTGIDLVSAIPFQAPADPARTVRGRFSPGTVMIPEDDSDTWELDRRDSLITHELYHTHQSARWGPLLLSYFPWFVWEVGGIAFDANVEAPEFSPYVRASLVSEGTNRFLAIPDPQGIEFESGDSVQVSQNGITRNLELGAAEGGRFRISAGVELRDGTDLFVRRRRTGGADFVRWTETLGETLSVGGLMMLLSGPILTAIPWLIALIVNVVRGNSFRFLWWLDFFPASVPDPDRPAAIRIAPVNDQRPELQPNDSVEVRTSTSSARTSVTAVGADGVVELEDVPPSEGPERALSIAKVASDDELGFAANKLINRMGFGWLRTLFDPYGRLQFRERTRPDSFWDWFRRTARWAFSSTSWAPLPFGYFFFDNFGPQLRGEGFLANMEQAASQQSGDLYSPIGRLRGRPTHVGDVGRYWYYHSNRFASVVTPDRQDAPGVHLRDQPDPLPPGALRPLGPRLVPSTTPGAVSAVLNDGCGAAAASGILVPDALVEKDPRSPEAVPANGPASFLPGARGWVPASPELERTVGAYVAFCRPGTHFVTVASGIPDGGDAAKAVAAKVQEINFEVPVQDVDVVVAGRAVANGGTIRLVQCQRAPIEVRPGGERRYSALLTRPREGSVLRRGEALVLQAQTADGIEPVEISRDYVSGPSRSTPTNSRVANSRAFPEVHLGGELAIPVRNFVVEVAHTVGVITTLDLATVQTSLAQSPPAVPEVRPGREAFVVVPARIQASRPRQSQTYAGPTSPFITHPSPAIVPERNISAELRPILGDGGVFRITFAPDDPPEEAVTLTWEIDVRATQTGAAGKPETLSAVLTTSALLQPHFRLESTGGGTNFALSRGATTPGIVLRPTDGVRAGSVVVTPSATLPTAIWVAGDEVTITAVPGTELGIRRVVVADAADPTRFARRTIRIVA